MIAYDFPLLGLFLTMVILFLWLAWIVLVIGTIVDIFRNGDIGGVGKAFWSLFVVIIPWLGVLIYLIAHGADMHRRIGQDPVPVGAHAVSAAL